MSRENKVVHVVNDQELLAGFWNWDEAQIFIDMVNDHGKDKPVFGKWLSEDGPQVEEIKVFGNAKEAFNSYEKEWEE